MRGAKVEGVRKQIQREWTLSQFSEEDLVMEGILHEADFAMDEALTWRNAAKTDVVNAMLKRRKVEDSE